jgi:kexin
VKDQNNDEEGSFLGWSMTLWGSAIDPDDTEKYELPDDPNEGHNLPPHPSATEELDQTKQHPKPTHALTDDHHASKTGEATPTATSTPDAADEGIFSHMYDLLSNQLWLIGAFGVVAIFGTCAGLFFWHRKRKLRKAKAAYAPLPGGDNMPMRSLDRGGPNAGNGMPGSGERSAGGTRELYDAFGVGSDEDEDEDENTALTASGRYGQQPRLDYHDGFLDDEGLSTSRTAQAPYRDEPEGTERQNAERSVSNSPPRPGSDGSGDGSWQDAASESLPPRT